MRRVIILLAISLMAIFSCSIRRTSKYEVLAIDDSFIADSVRVLIVSYNGNYLQLLFIDDEIVKHQNIKVGNSYSFLIDTVAKIDSLVVNVEGDTIKWHPTHIPECWRNSKVAICPSDTVSGLYIAR